MAVTVAGGLVQWMSRWRVVRYSGCLGGGWRVAPNCRHAPLVVWPASLTGEYTQGAAPVARCGPPLIRRVRCWHTEHGAPFADVYGHCKVAIKGALGTAFGHTCAVGIGATVDGVSIDQRRHRQTSPADDASTDITR